MRRLYLMVYSDTLGTREEVKKVVDELPEVLTWRYDLPHAFYLVSESSARELASTIRSARGNKGRFVIAEIADPTTYGWLTKDSWYFIQNKKAKPKE